MAYKPCRDCRSVRKCEVRRTMSLVRDATAEILDGLSIADMLHIKDGEGLSERERRSLRRSRVKRIGGKAVSAKPARMRASR
jgi:DNA-binding IscR family transcriptional regulator